MAGRAINNGVKGVFVGDVRFTNIIAALCNYLIMKLYIPVTVERYRGRWGGTEWNLFC